jgi:hypothetical protein
MAIRRRLEIMGEEREVVELEFEAQKEPWYEYTLADGGRFKIKMIVQRVFQVLDADGKPARTPDGSPFLVVQSANQLVVQE